MEPILAQALSTLLGAISTAVLLASAYYWGPSARQGRRDEREHREEWKHEDDVRDESRHNQDRERNYHRRHIGDDE